MQFTNQLFVEFRHNFLSHEHQLPVIVAYRIVNFSPSNRKEGPRREGRKKEGMHYSFSFSTQE